MSKLLNEILSRENMLLAYRKVISNKLLENKINVSSLSKGVYILKIKTDEKVFENKFIKE